MVVVPVPERGLVLESGFKANRDTNVETPTQIMQLDLTDGTMDELFKCARKGNPIHVAFGKAIVRINRVAHQVNEHSSPTSKSLIKLIQSLQYGTKQRHLNAAHAPSDTEIFSSCDNASNVLQLAGRVSHVLAIQKAEEAMASTDDALAKLQSSLASAKQAKESNQIHFIPDGSRLPPAKKQTMQSLKSSKGGSSLSFLRQNKSHIKDKNSSQIKSSSHQLGSASMLAMKSPNLTSTSSSAGVEERVQKIVRAVRTPLIHLLAMRPLSTRYLSQRLNCPQNIVEQILEKVGRPARIDPQKQELNDKTYKELDPWAFNYPDPADRDNAIQRSIAAFDRMRMSQEDPKWQTLYPREERNKGNTLSRLNHLAKGAIQQSTTPRIHVQHPEDSLDDKLPMDSHGENDQKGRLTPKGSEAMSRSKSTDQHKKKKRSEKEGQVKRLLSNGPKKLPSEAKEKESHPASKKGVSKKGPAPKSAPKSEEFVRDSDEEDGLEEYMAIDALSSSPTKPMSSTNLSPQVPASTPASKGVTSKASRRTLPTKPMTPKPLKHDSNVKVSKPVKPVHVVQASFPNLKAASSSDAKKKDDEATRRAESKAHPKKIPSSPAATPGAKARLSEAANQQGSTAMQKSLSRNRQGSSPHKPSPLGSSPPTNASEFGSFNHNDITPPSSTSSSGRSNNSNSTNSNACSMSSDAPYKINGHAISDSGRLSASDASLKRKANDLDGEIHNHKARSPLSNGHASPYINGTGRVMHNPAKKPRTSSEEETDSSTSPPSEHERKLLAAHRFKTLHAKYEKAYREVVNSPNASPEQVQLVTKMHVRLDEMKRNIARGRY